jgi:glycosyltransferase involved in cell wall biosynthesis
MSDQRIRVLSLVSGLAIGATGGGAEKFGLEVARHLDPQRFESIVCAFWRRGNPGEEHWQSLLEADGVRVFFAVKRGQRFSFRDYYAGLRRILAEVCSGVDVVHSHFQLGSIAAVLLRRSLRAAGTVRTAHGTVLREWTNTVAGRASRLVFTRTVFPLSFDQEVGVSQAATDSLNAVWIRRLIRKRAIMIPNAIPLSLAGTVDRAAKRRELGLPDEAVVIGSVGRLTTQKGYRYLIEAAPRIFARPGDVRILLVGDGELRHELESQARALGVADRVMFIGPRSDVPEIYRVMDLFILPSLWEGLPTVVLESIAHRVPVIATDIPGTRDLIRDGYNGWLAPPADAEALAERVLDALALPAIWSAVSARAYGETLPLYSVERIAQQYEQLYLALCGRSQTST